MPGFRHISPIIALILLAIPASATSHSVSATAPAVAAIEAGSGGGWREVQSTPIAALDGIDLNPQQGGILSFIGPSGSGKTTLMRVISSMRGGRIENGEPNRDGWVYFDLDAGTIKVVDAKGGRLVDLADALAMGGLFGAASGGGNAAIHDKIDNALADAYAQASQAMQHLPKGQREAALAALRAQLGISNEALSAGQQQRTALARAMTAPPRVLIIDEPMGHLNGQEVAHLMVEIDGASRFEIWGTDPRNVPGGPEALAGLEKLNGLFTAITGGPMPADTPVSVLPAAGVIPVRVVDVLTGETWDLEKGGAFSVAERPWIPNDGG